MNVCESCWKEETQCTYEKRIEIKGHWKEENQYDYDPRNIVEIDDNIFPNVHSLNLKGYRTKYCCEGHVEPNKLLCLYIMFQERYEFPSMPVDGDFKPRKNTIYYIEKSKSSEEKKLQTKLNGLEQLAKWVDSLENRMKLEV